MYGVFFRIEMSDHKFGVENGIKCRDVIKMLKNTLNDDAMTQRRVYEW